MAKTTRFNGPSIEPVVIRRPGIGRIDRCLGTNLSPPLTSDENPSPPLAPDLLSPAPIAENHSEVAAPVPNSTAPLTGGPGQATPVRLSNKRRPAKAKAKATPTPTPAPKPTNPRQANVRSVSPSEFDDDF